MIREAVDFHLVPAHQEAIHLRLLNWARAQRNKTGQACAPMFRQYRSTDQWGGAIVAIPVNQHDAAKINKAWKVLPDKHRDAIGWHYVNTTSPIKACKKIGCTLDGLARYVVDARQMLINRRV